MPHSQSPAGRHARESADGRRGNGRTVSIAVVTFYTVLFFAVMWPVYPLFATIEPRVLGVPFSLAYVVVCLLLSFFVLLGYFLWEESRGVNVPIEEDD